LQWSARRPRSNGRSAGARTVRQQRQTWAIRQAGRRVARPNPRRPGSGAAPSQRTRRLSGWGSPHLLRLVAPSATSAPQSGD